MIVTTFPADPDVDPSCHLDLRSEYALFMKLVLACLLLLVPARVLGQVDLAIPLAFEQKASECENKWFSYRAKDGGSLLGYLYVDPQAGFTIEHYGYLDLRNGQYVAVASELQGKARLIERVGEDFPARCLDDPTALRLGLPVPPESMKFYKDTRPAGQHHTAWAYFYNHIGASAGALVHVAQARAAGDSSPQLTFEHGFALNATDRFDEAVALLSAPAQARDCPPDTIAELAYAHLRLKDYRTAIDLYERALKAGGTKGSSRKWEFALNIASAYQALGDLPARDKWLERSNKYKASKPEASAW